MRALACRLLLCLVLISTMMGIAQASSESHRYLRNALHFYEVGQFEKSKAYFIALLSIGNSLERKTARDYLRKPQLTSYINRRRYSQPVSPFRRSQFYLEKGIRLYQAGDYQGAVNYLDAVLRSGTEEQKAAAQSYLERPELRDLELTREREVGFEAAEEGVAAESTVKVGGALKEEVAARLQSPSGLTSLRTVGILSITGQWADWMSYRMSGRLWYDGVYDLTRRYPDAVAENQKTDGQLRDAFIDISQGDWDLRLGKQHIVWGEAVGLFYADVVNAKDLREFVLPEFDFIRIPEWAMDMEYTKGRLHTELIWLPWPEMDKVGRPGSEFQFAVPNVPGFQSLYGRAEKPKAILENGEGGGRMAWRASGWDLGAFALRTWDKSPVYRRTFQPGQITLTETHPRMTVSGATFAKELEDIVFKGEFVYSPRKHFQSTDPAAVDGIVAKDMMDYLVSADHTFGNRLDASLQVSQRYIPHYQSDLFQAVPLRTIVTLWLKTQWGERLEPETLWIQDVTRRDTMVRPKLTWKAASHWKLAIGADFFAGAPEGLFGEFTGHNRATGEIRYEY